MADWASGAARALLVKGAGDRFGEAPLPTLPPLGGGLSDGQRIASSHSDTRISPPPSGGRPGGGLLPWLYRLLPLLAFAVIVYVVLSNLSNTPTATIKPEIEIDQTSPVVVPVPSTGGAASAASPAPAPSAVTAASAPSALPSSMAALIRTWYAKLADPPARLWGLHPAGWLLLLLGMEALAYPLTRARTASLARLRTREVLREQHLHVPLPPRSPRLAGDCRDDVREAARLLRRPQVPDRTPLPARTGAPLDVSATVRASARAGGRFVPIAKGQRVARRLVVLIDRARPDEPLALLMHRLTQALADEGAAVVTRHFDRDPRRALRPGAQPGDVLVLCSDGRGLLDARDGVLRPWLAREVGQAWPLRVLLTPVPVASWGAAEDRLAGEGGFVVLPAVSWALPALARRVVSAQDGRAEAALELPFVHGAPARWPGLLRGQALRWLSPTVPAEEDVAALLRQLRGLLGARGFGWLAACAAYPQMSLALAEHLAVELDTLAGQGDRDHDDARLREAQWLALAHLPWLRQGWMPDWLRRALLRELTAAQRERLGEALRALLNQDGTGGLDMGRIATAYLRRRFTSWLRRGEPAGSPLRDVIYLGLLDGTIDKELALGLDAKTAGRVRGKVEPAWRRPVLQGLAAVPVMAVMLWGVVLPYFPKVARTPDMAAGTRFRDCKDDACPWMVVVPAGNFVMGSPADEPNRDSDEGPQHSVRVTKFAMARFEVTQGQWKALMGSNPSAVKDCGDDCPVENVSWDDAQAYVKKLSEKTGQQYRLPSEAEWEYAARAGTTTAYAFGATLSESQANMGNKTVRVGSYSANNFGLSDMHGNVWEWVQDCWHVTYKNAPTNGDAWETECTEARRVLRGGSWYNLPRDLRSANRNGITPGFRNGNSGFRIARTF